MNSPTAARSWRRATSISFQHLTSVSSITDVCVWFETSAGYFTPTWFKLQPVVWCARKALNAGWWTRAISSFRYNTGPYFKVVPVQFPQNFLEIPPGLNPPCLQPEITSVQEHVLRVIELLWYSQFVLYVRTWWHLLRSYSGSSGRWTSRPSLRPGSRIVVPEWVTTRNTLQLSGGCWEIPGDQQRNPRLNIINSLLCW